MRSRSFKIFASLVALACLQVVWWAYLLAEANPKHIFMVTAEGSFFLIVLISGFYWLRKSLLEELKFKEAKSDFLAAVTHELKTPITNVRLCLDTLERQDLALESRSLYLQRAQTALDKLLEEIETILAVSGDTSDQKHPTMLTDIIEQVLKNLINENQKISIDCNDDVFILPGNESRMIIKNIVDNAVRYSQNTDKTQQILIQSKLNQRGLTLTIRDNGCGFTQEESYHLFEPFFRGSSKNQIRGTGLGLTLAKRLADRHGIKITLISDGPQQGATATVFWPNGLLNSTRDQLEDAKTNKKLNFNGEIL